MHYWGDNWFKEHGDSLDKAISWLYNEMHKCHINYMNKEKWGMNDVEWVYFWDGGIYSLFFNGRFYIGTTHRYKYKWMKNLANKIHHFIYFTLDDKIIKPLCKRLGITKRVNDWQADQYNRIYQEACKKWPDLIEELIADDCSGYELIKPGKYGDIDGAIIHNKHWTTI